MCNPNPSKPNVLPAVPKTITAAPDNEYTYNGYTIHETFDPEGPRFSDCIVRLFS